MCRDDNLTKDRFFQDSEDSEYEENLLDYTPRYIKLLLREEKANIPLLSHQRQWIRVLKLYSFPQLLSEDDVEPIGTLPFLSVLEIIGYRVPSLRFLSQLTRLEVL